MRRLHHGAMCIAKTAKCRKIYWDDSSDTYSIMASELNQYMANARAVGLCMRAKVSFSSTVGGTYIVVANKWLRGRGVDYWSTGLWSSF